MASSRGHKQSQRRTKPIQLAIRVSVEEKQAFERAAAIAGASVSSWIRERLRAASLRELDIVGQLAPFLAGSPKVKTHG